MADVLIIDDAPLMRRLIIRILRGEGHTVREVDNGRSGIAEFRRQRPALVISDLVMPDMEGIETIRALRQDDPAIPIIAISGGNPVHLKAAGALGAAATLAKPFSDDALLSIVEGLLAGSHATLTGDYCPISDDETIDRQEARQRGLTRYFTGKPCSRGHIAQRYVSDQTCCECRKSKSSEPDFELSSRERR
jgi:CheY-like chemotaxis protein